MGIAGENQAMNKWDTFWLFIALAITITLYATGREWQFWAFLTQFNALCTFTKAIVEIIEKGK